MSRDDFDYAAAWHSLAGWLEGCQKNGRELTAQDMEEALLYGVEMGLYYPQRARGAA